MLGLKLFALRGSFRSGIAVHGVGLRSAVLLGLGFKGLGLRV